MPQMRSGGNSVALLDSSIFKWKSVMLTNSCNPPYRNLQIPATQSRDSRSGTCTQSWVRVFSARSVSMMLVCACNLALHAKVTKARPATQTYKLYGTEIRSELRAPPTDLRMRRCWSPCSPWFAGLERKLSLTSPEVHTSGIQCPHWQETRRLWSWLESQSPHDLSTLTWSSSHQRGSHYRLRMGLCRR